MTTSRTLAIIQCKPAGHSRKGGQDKSPHMAAEWPEEQGDSRVTAAIGRKNEKLVAWQNVSGQAGFKVQTCIRLT